MTGIKNKIANWLAYVVSGALILIAAVFAYTSLVPVDVLQNWKLTLDKTEYQAGENFVVHSQFDKVKNVTGIAKRYIVCSAWNGSQNRIPVSEAAADRPAQSSKSEIYLKMPSDIPNLPATCKLEIVIEYEIYGFRRHTETNDTPSFTVIPKPGEQSIIPQDEQSNTDSDNTVVENTPQTRSKANSPSLVPVPEMPLSPPPVPATPAPENSPVVPPQPLLCQLPIVSPVVNPILGIVNWATGIKTC